MTPGASRRDQTLLKEWLTSREVNRYINESLKREGLGLPIQRNRCKEAFATMFYEQGPPRTPYSKPMVLPGYSATKREIFKSHFGWLCLRFWQWLTGEDPVSALILLAALLARFISAWTKKPARDLLKSGSGFLWPYLLGELIVCAAMLVQQRAAADPRHLNHRTTLAVAMSSIASPILDSIASIYLGNLKSFADSNAASIIGKLTCDIFVAVVTFIPMWKSMKKCGLKSVLTQNLDMPLELWEQVPTEYKLWAMESLANHYDQRIRESRDRRYDD